MNRLKSQIISSAIEEMKVPEQGTAIRRYCFSDDFIGFSGHFPQYPVLPAFVQILTALTLAEDLEGYTLSVQRVERAKFHIEIKPGQEVEVQCRERLLKGRKGYEVQLTVAEGVAASFWIGLEKSAKDPH